MSSENAPSGFDLVLIAGGRLPRASASWAMKFTAILRLRTGRAHPFSHAGGGWPAFPGGWVYFAGRAGGGDRGWAGLPAGRPVGRVCDWYPILVVAWNSGRELWYRLMDATDPEMTALVEQTPRRLRGFCGRGHPHPLAGTLATVRTAYHRGGTAPDLESHQIAETVRHALFHALPSLQEVTVHVDPLDDPPGSAHGLTAHHTVST